MYVGCVVVSLALQERNSASLLVLIEERNLAFLKPCNLIIRRNIKTMKKKIYKVIAAGMAMSLTLALPITAQAGFGFNPDAHDDTDRGAMPDDYGVDYVSDGGGSDSGSSEPSYDSGNTDYSSGSDSNSNAHDDTDYDEVPDNDGDNYKPASTTVPTTASTTASALKGSDKVVNVPGKEKFRSVIIKGHETYAVYHMGNNVVSVSVTDKDNKVVAYKDAALYKAEDGKHYINITLADGVDAADMNVTVTKGDITYLTRLGVAGITVNGVVKADVAAIQAEAAAAAETVAK